MALDLNQEEVQALEEEQVLLSAPVNGKRKVSAALLSPPSTQGSISSSSGSTGSASVRIRPGNAQIPFDLPESDKSVAAVEFCGFTRTRAGEIFGRWAGKQVQNPYSLVDFMIGEIDNLNLEPLVSMERSEAMVLLGISEELRTALTLPKFTAIWRSERAHFWLVDTVKMRYHTLQTLLAKLKNCAVETIRQRKTRGQGKRAKVAGAIDPAGASSSSTPASQQPPSNFSAIVSSKSNTLPSAYVVVQSPPTIRPDHYVYYKGKSAAQLMAGPNGDNLILEDGSINMDAIESFRGGDFNMRDQAWYFSKEEGTAEQYRQYQIARDTRAETWIVRISLPKSFVDGLKKKEIWYSADFKQFVWYCRNKGNKGKPVPSKFDDWLPSGGAQFIEGHICFRDEDFMTGLKKENVQQHISESDLMYNGNKKATQSVFVDLNLRERLNELLRGNIYVEIFSPVDTPYGSM
ncbi:uncharacterized protein RAG0_00025 [Rhynchosporium agropyri]|uniref:Uncharacterized protein n=1 Tax=Rhynchosporium agropyri TaxID=914238 RepID=A0A1E1JR02_9HELO|nr:uncharacterized protein RAG0_00025 [Rhynchosporium agropyri]